MASSPGPEDYNSNVPFSLSKGVTSLKKCKSCNNVMFFKTYRCKHCRHRCRKKCGSHSSGPVSGRRNSTPRTYTGEEHWSKVLQANEVNSNLVALPCHGHHVLRQMCCEKASKEAEKAAKAASKQVAKDTNIFSTLYSRFCEWVASTKKDSLLGRKSTSRRTSHSKSRPENNHTMHMDCDLSAFMPSSPEELHKCYHTSVSSEDSEFSSFLTSYSSTCSNLTLTSDSTTSERHRAYTDPWLLPHGMVGGAYYMMGASRGNSGRLTPNSPSSPCPSDPYFIVHSVPGTACPSDTEDGIFDSFGLVSSDGHASVFDSMASTPRIQAKVKRTRKHPSMSVWTMDNTEPKENCNALCATWPPSNKRRSDLETSDSGDDCADLDESVFSADDLEIRTAMAGVRDSLGEDCSIQFSDLEFGECIRDGRRHNIYRGRWHGDVMIHTYRNLSREEETEFLSEVTKLNMVRHENVALFMGACLEPPNLAVITSVVKGASLYEEIHMKTEKLSLHTRVNIVRQVAQGMGYLHARGIVIRKLNSKNVYLEPKVKLCLLDYGMAERKYDRVGYGCLPRGNLCYIAPEIMKTLRIVPPSVETTAPFTMATDVYAFGTLLYEVVTGQFPFARTPSEVLIWQVGRGKRQSLKHVKCVSTLRVLIEKSWSKVPESRITFSEINQELQQNASLHKRHSSSHPESLNRTGMVARGSSLFP